MLRKFYLNELSIIIIYSILELPDNNQSDYTIQGVFIVLIVLLQKVILIYHPNTQLLINQSFGGTP